MARDGSYGISGSFPIPQSSDQKKFKKKKSAFKPQLIQILPFSMLGLTQCMPFSLAVDLPAFFILPLPQAEIKTDIIRSPFGERFLTAV